jgi:hypothetical protein
VRPAARTERPLQQAQPPLLCPLRPAPHTHHTRRTSYSSSTHGGVTCISRVFPARSVLAADESVLVVPWGVKGRQPSLAGRRHKGQERPAAMVATHLRLVVSQTLTLHGILRAGSTDPCFSIREIDIKVPQHPAERAAACATCPHGGPRCTRLSTSNDGTRRQTHSWTLPLCACACFVCVCA